MEFKTTYWRICLINAKIFGENRAPSLTGYCGLLSGGSKEIILAGYGKNRDTVTPYAHAICHALDIVGDNPTSEGTLFAIMPNNAGVRTYLLEHAPLWKTRNVNGKSQIPEARDEWIRAADSFLNKEFLLDSSYRVFKGRRRIIENALEIVREIAGEQGVKRDGFCRIDQSAFGDLA